MVNLQQDSPQTSSDGKAVLLEKIADTINATASAKMVFAEPLERDGVTVVPVARVKCTFGGGEGQNPIDHMTGLGGGGKLHASPIGYIEMKNGTSRFHTIIDPVAIGRVALCALGISMWAVTKIAKHR